MGTQGGIWGLRANGDEFPLETSISQVEAEGKKFLTVILRDISERKRAERALRSLSDCNDSLMRATDEPSLLQRICDLVVNAGGYRMAWVGYADRDEKKTVRVVAESGFETGYLENVNLTWADEERGRGPAGIAIRTGEVNVCHDTSSDPRFAPWRESAIGQGYRSCMALPLKSGEEVLGVIAIYATEVGVFDAAEQRLLAELASNLSYGIVALRARAERKWAVEALRESEQRYRLLFGEMVVWFALLEVIYDENGKPCDHRYLDANPAFETHSGLTRDRVLGKTIREVLPGLEPFWIETYGKVATTGESIHFESYVQPLERWLEVTAFRTRHDQVGVTFADITERKRAEEMRERLAAVVESSDDAIIGKTLDGVITSWNRGAENLFGYSSSEAEGKPIAMLLPPERTSEELDILARIGRGESVERFETVRVRKDGKTIDVSVTISPIRNSSGAIVGASKIARDITDRKRADQRLADKVEELARSNRELEQFAYVASHDLQEPLRMVASYTQLLAERYCGKLDENADKFLGYAREGPLRMQVLIRDLLAFSRVVRADVTRKNVDCNVALEEAVQSLTAAIEESGAVVTHDQLPIVWADQTQIAQVLQNLIGNAIKFRNGEPPECAVSAEKSGRNWLFSVRDNGIGIAPEYTENIFVVFQRLHARSEYPGNGIGLAICKKIIEHYGGTIWVESQVGQGSTFKFILPAAAPEEERCARS